MSRQSPRGTCVSEMNMPFPPLSGASLGQKTRGAALAAPLIRNPPLSLGADYQGTSLRNPFFFLLVDSFLESSLLCESPVFAASVAGVVLASVASLFVSVPVVEASLFAGVSAAPAAAGGFFAASSLAAALGVVVVGAVVAGAPAAGVNSVPASFGGSLVAGALAVPSLTAGAAFSDPTVSAVPVDPVVPGTTVATIPVPAPPADFPPGVSKSPADWSDSGCMFGAPVLAADRNSPFGPLFIKSSGFL